MSNYYYNNNSSYFAPQGFSMLPTGVKNLLIINAIVFFARYVFSFSGIDLNAYLALYPVRTPFFHFYQYITYMFAHASFGHIFFNMFALWMFGYALENLWGTRRFLIYYLLCGLGAGLTCTLLLNSSTVGASGAVFGILLAFGLTYPNERIYLYFLFPIRAIWFVLGYAAIELIDGILATNDGIAHFAHLGGMLTGLVILLIWRRQHKIY